MSHPNCPKIFVVEDDQDIRETFVDALTLEGYGVESFADGQFMELFHKLPATILPIPVFLVSASSIEPHSVKMGCKGFMKKPINLDAMLTIVETFCERSSKAA